MQHQPSIKYKNVFTNSPTRSLYTNVKIDATSPTKLKCNDSFFAVPFGTGAVGIFPIKLDGKDTIKIENNCPLTLAHGKPIADFTFSPLERSILATSSRADGLIRIWKIPSDVQSLPNTQNPQRELDVASIYLAGHEKKIELLSFHPTVGNILMSSSADSTIRLWEIESMQDQIVMSSLEDTTIQSTSFDYYGNVFAATTSNSHLCIYDARSQTTPVASVNTEFNQSKGCKVSWLSPDPLIAVSGFKDKGVREFLIYDIRYPEKGAVQTLTVQGTGIGLLNPIWDPALPLMYLTSRGEGVRLYELHYGSLDYVTMLKVEKQATSMDLMPKTVCNSVKCEIARFLRIGTDNAVETTGVFVPRVNGENIHQEDLYPAMACIDPSSNSEVWFDQKQTIEPIMVDFLTLIEPKTESNGPVAAIENTASSQQSTAERLKFLVPTSASGTYKKSKSTARRAPSSISPSNSSNNLSFAFGGGSQSFANSSSTATTTTESLVSAMAVYLDGQVSVEKRGWFGSVWQPHYLSLKKSKLYIFSDHDSESPIYYISLSAVKKIEGFEVSKDASNPNPNAFKLGFGIESLEQTWRFKTSTYMERENWISTLTKAMNNAKGELVVESSLSHHQQQKSSISQHLEPPSTAMKPVASPNSNNSNKPPSSPTNPTIASNSKAQVSATSSSSSSFRVKGNREGAILFGEMKCMSSSEAFSKSRGKWSKHIVVLDEDGLVHIYTDDFKEFTLGKPPIESINVSNAISVRLSNLTSRHNPPLSSETIDASITNVFQINTSKRVVFFQARSAFESANWVLEIQRIVTAKELSPANEFIGRDVMEGSIIDLRSSSNVSLTNTLTGAPEGTNFWLTVIDGAFYYFLSNLSTNPILVIGASQFEEILIPQDLNYSDLITTDGGGDEDNDDASVHHHHRKSISRKRISSVSAPPPLSSLFFEVAFSSGKRFRHHVNSLSERNHWIQRLIKVRMDSFDLFAKVGITSDQVLKEEVTRAKGDVLLEADMKSNIQYLDEKKLEKGEQLALIATLGKVRLSILLVEPTWKSLRSDGCYVLDNGNTIYHWNGPKSSRMCQARAMGVASRIRKERGTKPKVHLVENDDHELLRKFLLALGLTDNSYLAVMSGLTQSDIQLLEAVPPFRLFKVVVHTNIRKRKLQLVYEGYGPSKNILESDTAYVLQCHPGEVFVWYGKTSSTDTRAIANAVSRRIALQYHQEAHQNGVGGVWISALRLFEGSEYAVWKEKFIDYEGSLPISMRMVEKKGNIVRSIVQIPIDVPKMVAITPFIDNSCVDDGATGTIEIFRVKDFQREHVEKKNIGQFFRGESYIVLYTYRPPNSGVDKCISYFWQGFESSITEKGTSALMTIELTEKAGIDVTHIRVVEGKEPKHFCLMFDKTHITRLGTFTSETNIKAAGAVCFEIRQFHNDKICKVVEAEVNELILQSDNVGLIVLATGTIYIWRGKYSLDCEVETATEIAKRYSSEIPKIVKQETTTTVADFPSDLSSLFHGNGYFKTLTSIQQPPQPQHHTHRSNPRLFSCSSGSGMVKVEEVVKYQQEDLDHNIVMILDGVEGIWVWIGFQAKTNEKVIGMETAQKYADIKYPQSSTRLNVTYSFQEPVEFTRHFHGWTKKKFPKDRRTAAIRVRTLTEVLVEYKKETYTIDVLLSEKLPENVDPTKLEMYLSEEDFEILFSMKREEYLAIQPWKREGIKKKVGFF